MTTTISIETDPIKDSEVPSPTLTILAMFGLLLVAYMVNAMDRLVFPLLASDIRKEYGFTVADTGLIATVFTLGMAIAGWPAAYFIARFSRKAVVLAGILIFSVGTGLIAMSHGFFAYSGDAGRLFQSEAGQVFQSHAGHDSDLKPDSWRAPGSYVFLT